MLVDMEVMVALNVAVVGGVGGNGAKGQGLSSGAWEIGDDSALTVSDDVSHFL